MPAIERYNGSTFRTIRAALRRLPVADHPHVLILSARYGLIATDRLIPNYDQRMDATGATAIAADVRCTLRTHLHRYGPYRETLIHLGAAYRPALALALVDAAIQRDLGTCRSTDGGIGRRLGQLKRWLAGVDAHA
jgi:hypothetical protein